MDRFPHVVPNMMQQATTHGRDTLQPKRFSAVANAPDKNQQLHVFPDATLANDTDVKQDRILCASCETVNNVTPTGISNIIAADVTSCTSGLPQNTFWNKELGHSGGLSDQDGQTKTRVCRGRNPQRNTKQTQRISTPCLRRVPAAHGFKQYVLGPHAQRYADDEFQALHAETYRQCDDLQQRTTEDTTSYTKDHQTPSLHRRGGYHKCHPGHQTAYPGHQRSQRCNCQLTCARVNAQVTGWVANTSNADSRL